MDLVSVQIWIPDVNNETSRYTTKCYNMSMVNLSILYLSNRFKSFFCLDFLKLRIIMPYFPSPFVR